jgi:glycosyltransferase involved in cell wall biosynthesis
MSATRDSGTTVIVPSYNGERHLRHTLDSLAAQSLAPSAIIVVDDGSQDATTDIAEAHPVVTRVVRQTHSGVAVARNRGLAVARTPWVAFVDQDDLWHRSRLETLKALADQTRSLAVASTELPFAYESDRAALAAVGDGRDRWPQRWIEQDADAQLVDSDTADASREITEITLDHLLEGAAMVTTAVLYDTETAIAAGGCAPHARAVDDHVLNLNVARIAGPIFRIDSKDLLYRIHPSSTSTTSPMAAPFLSTQAAIRLGGTFPGGESTPGPNMRHLLYGLHLTELSATDQKALLDLTVPAGEWWRWRMRWRLRRWGLR